MDLESLKNNKDLYFRLKVFINDLMKFNYSNNSDKLNNLSCNHPEYYFSLYYFTEDEIEYILDFRNSSGFTYRELFDSFIKLKENSYEICTSHDIAPFMFVIFEINRNFNKEKEFKKKYKKFKGLI